MTWPDYLVLFGAILGIAVYGIWRSRKNRDLGSYLKGAGDANWLVIGLSVMATQASAITFLSTPGQGYEGGLGFVQNYFGAPFALILIAAVFLPIYRRLKVYTAYEYLGNRFDAKTRLLGAGLFLLNRGLGAGITIYAPAIVLSTVMGWRLDLTIIGSGLVVIAYTVSGGTDAVTHTQKYQLAVVFAGMAAAFAVLISMLPANVSTRDVFTVAGGFHKLQAVDFSVSFGKRYTFWSGMIGGLFLALSYFGTDQSQVQRYISGASLRESRMGLMFNAICKIPMQFFILLLGCYLFVFYQFYRPPVLFNQTAWHQGLATPSGPRLAESERRLGAAHDEKLVAIRRWLDASHRGDTSAAEASRLQAVAANARETQARKDASKTLKDAGVKSSNDTDYVFIRFIVEELPHGLIGLLMAAFFAAALSSKAAELNALGSATTIDVYRHLVKREDAHYYKASRLFTVFWGLLAIGFALFANLSENLIQATNILGSVFYGVILGIFLGAFFFKKIEGTAIFIGAVVAQLVVFACYFRIGERVTYLWYNVIGCALCLVIAASLQAIFDRRKELAA
ncbi:MAG TPA: sodium:solute symporter [Fimbriimonadaceae bacterium]|nr:sodium:solute symporter [Fimbriimonadaceae bacterium]